jgi:hypothetical protein
MSLPDYDVLTGLSVADGGRMPVTVLAAQAPASRAQAAHSLDEIADAVAEVSRKHAPPLGPAKHLRLPPWIPAAAGRRARRARRDLRSREARGILSRNLSSLLLAIT